VIALTSCITIWINFRPSPPSYPPTAEWDFPHQTRVTRWITTAFHLDTQNVMRGTAPRVFVFSQLRKHETMTLTFYERKYWNSGTGTGKEFLVIDRFLKRPAQEVDTLFRCVRRK